ncbi:MAG: GAF domain-containing sensor histidine kinase [bacterium]
MEHKPKDSTERAMGDDEQMQLMHKLTERVKELDCLYGISKIIEKYGSSLEDILQGIVNVIPPGWQYPEITCSRIAVEDQEFRTDNFKETAWKQSADVFASGIRSGVVEVYYLEERPEADEGPFIKEERSLIEAIAERVGRAIAHRRSEEAVLQREELLSSLSQKVITVLEEERERVARELHDSIGQQLAAMRLEIRWLKDKLFENADEEAFQNLMNITLNASEELKHICMGLRPAILDKMGFVAALNELIKEFGANRDFNIVSNITPIDESNLKPAIAINIYRILQETLSNVARHSRAKNAEISLAAKGMAFELEVKDDGCGLPQGEPFKKHGFGIIGMKERAKIIGGDFVIESKPGEGTRIGVTFPIKKMNGAGI